MNKYKLFIEDFYNTYFKEHVTKFFSEQNENVRFLEKWSDIIIQLILFILSLVLIYLLIKIFIIIIIFIIDKIKPNKKVNWHVRTPANNIGGGQEIYARYLTGQTNRKKFLMNYTKNNIDSVKFSRKARKRKKNTTSRIPLIREVYAKRR